MKAQVLLPKIFNFPFTYNTNQIILKTGDLVEVPFGKKKEIGVIWKNNSFELKDIKIKNINKKVKNYSIDNLLIKTFNQFGFIHGISQSYGISDKVAEVMFAYGKMEEKTIRNYIAILEFKNNPKSYLELWEDALKKKLFETDEDAVTEMLTGMADGKSYGDANRAMTEDYSTLKDPNTVSALNVDGFRSLFRRWSFSILYDEEKQELLRQC